MVQLVLLDDHLQPQPLFRIDDKRTFEVYGNVFEAIDEPSAGQGHSVLFRQFVLRLLGREQTLNGNTGGGARVMQFALKYVF